LRLAIHEHEHLGLAAFGGVAVNQIPIALAELTQEVPQRCW
jgi:hypothetical protein